MHSTRAFAAALALASTTACSDDVPTVRSVEGPAVTAQQASFSASGSAGGDNNRKIAIRDNCDPRDPTWAPSGGCLLSQGDVTNAEFTAFLRSPLTILPNEHLVGHPSWRMEPSYLSITSGKDLRVSNEGGRTHTFTEVAQFGGGRVPPLNVGLTPVPECATAINIAPGARTDVNLSDGLHRFECCIHPWMRAAVRVSSK